MFSPMRGVVPLKLKKFGALSVPKTQRNAEEDITKENAPPQ